MRDFLHYLLLEARNYEALIPARAGAVIDRKAIQIQTDRESVMAMGYETVTGLGLNSENDPIYVVRSQISRLLDNRSTATSIRGTMVLDVVTKAWHARLQDKTPSRFKFGSVGEWPYTQPVQGDVA